MGKNKNKTASSGFSTTTKRWLWVIALLVVCIYTIIAWVGGGGAIGTKLYHGLFYLFGNAYIIVPASLLVTAGSVVYSLHHQLDRIRIISAAIFLLSTMILIQLVAPVNNEISGGIIGASLASGGINLLGPVGFTVIIIAIALATLIIIFAPEYDPHDLIEKLFGKFKKTDSVLIDDNSDIEQAVTKSGIEEPSDINPVGPIENTSFDVKSGSVDKNDRSIKNSGKDSDDNELMLPNEMLLQKPYTPPPLSLLSTDKGKPGVGDIKANANIIKRTFQNFGIRVEMDEVSIGPTVTRYSFKPAEGVRLSKIISLQSNLELALAAHPVRIEAPIPGKALVGIEVPNSSKTTVGLASLLQSGEFRNSDKPLLITLGKGISGSSFFTDIAKAPHMMIAGATGSGKSVTLHVLINSLLFRNSPENLRLIMIDPKRVELTLYNGIPHLLNPVITQPKKAVMALKWAVKEMERRYEVLQEERVQNIESYHKNIVQPAYKKAEDPNSVDLPEKMPYLVLILDEVGDLMQIYPKELEAEIIRLAQMSRAVGIHLVLTTQRPDKKIITGLIKANVPTRIALQVSSNIESRIILDAGGAEDLLGAGDMLFQSATMSKPTRIQSPYISEKEVKSVVKHLKDLYADELPDQVNIAEDDQTTDLFSIDLESVESEEDQDDLYNEAVATVVQAGKASTSYLQRRLKIGYSRAARIMDDLESNGIIGAQEGSKAREVLIDPNELE